MSALSQLARVVRRKESVEVGGVVKKRSQINIQPFNHSPRNVVFDLRKSRLVKVVHVVPEALTPQGGRAERKKPAKMVSRYQAASLRLLAAQAPDSGWPAVYTRPQKLPGLV